MGVCRFKLEPKNRHVSRSWCLGSAHKYNHSVERQKEKKAGALAQSAKCATVSIRRLCQIKALITSACLKHFQSRDLTTGLKMVSTAVHMKPFSMVERVKHVGSTDSCPTADAKRV